MPKPSFLTDNVFDNDTLAANNVATGFDVDNIRDRRPYTHWVSNDPGPAIDLINVDCGVVRSADTIGIAGHNLSGSTLRIQTSATGAWVGEEVEVFSTTLTSNKFMMASFVAASAQYWQARIEVATGADAAFIGVLMVGTRLEMPFNIPGDIQPFSYDVKTNQKVSEAAYILGVDVKHTRLRANVRAKYFSSSWYENTFFPFWEANKRAPFFFAWDLTQWPDYTMFGQFTGKFNPTYFRYDTIKSMSLAIEGVDQ